MPDNRAEVHLVTRKRREIDCQVIRREVALRNQFLKAHQQRIAGKRRETLVRRVPVTRGTQREHLPDPLAGPGQEVNEPISASAKVTDTESSGQRGGMEKNAAAAGKFHARILR